MSAHGNDQASKEARSLNKTESVAVGHMEAGHMEFTERPFTTLSAMSIGASTTNTVCGVLLILGTTIPSGGYVLLLYGFLGMAVVGVVSAICLAELASAMPDPGGQYIWTAVLSPPGPRRFLSYITALFSWAGAVCTGASVCLVAPELLFDLVALLDPTFHYKPWMGFLAYQLTNIVMLVPALFERPLPSIGRALLAYLVIFCLAYFIGILAGTKDHASAKDVFTGHYNTTGWSSGVAALIGINGLNWGFSCLDAIVHIADEIPRPRENIPKALMWTIIIGFVSGIAIIFASLFAITDFETQYSTMTMMYTIYGNSRAAAIGFQVLLTISSVGAMVGIHVWQSRLAWTIAMNNGFPFSRYISKIAGPPFRTPIWALVFSATFTAILGCLYLASEVAFSSFVSAGILFQYISYAVPIILMLMKGRDKIIPGPFWYPKLGLISNVVFLAWAAVALVFFCFPYSLPVEAGEMNYVSVVIAGIFTFGLVVWFSYAKKHFSYPELGSSHVINDSNVAASATKGAEST